MNIYYIAGVHNVGCKKNELSLIKIIVINTSYLKSTKVQKVMK